jgi:hypothetical protein
VRLRRRQRSQRRELSSQLASDAEALYRILALARGLQAGGIDAMSVTQVLDLADPAGEWAKTAGRLVAEPPRGMLSGEPVMVRPDPRADPLTGCLPVTPEPPA